MHDQYTALVAVSDTAYSFDSLFSYKVPKSLSDSIKKGKRVLVPFGKGNAIREGMVFECIQSSEDDQRLKAIIDVLDEECALDNEMLEMAKYLSETTFCTYYEAVKAVLPPAMRYKKHSVFVLNTQNINAPLNDAELCYLQSIEGIKNISKRIEADFAKNQNVINSLIDKGVITQSGLLKRKAGELFVKVAAVTEDFKQNQLNYKLTPKQSKAAKFILENTGATVREVCEHCDINEGVVKKLRDNGVVLLFEERKYRIPKSDVSQRSLDEIELSDHQFSAYSRIASHLKRSEQTAKAFLLHGVTGSGKTAVFAKLIQKAVDCGKKVIYLVPEISLTPQMSQYFVSLFGDRVALIHSALSMGRRLDEYTRIKNGDVDIVIGTRSAIFAPLKDIGLIIIDEEGSSTYKSESAPRYNTIAVARHRCRTHKSVLLLASATPTIESYYLAQKGVYELVTLSERYHKNPLPDTEIIDMSEEELYGKYSSFSLSLKNAVDENLKNKEQTILLLNRRGYHTIINCRDCHKAIFCPSCSVPMTYHKTKNILMCHYCGHSEDFNNECPECHGTHLKPGGFGTQKLEEEVAELFPDARVLRMDADTSSNMLEYEKAYDEFSKGEYDILLGTQMIGKGLDFPNVTLVGVLSIDKALYTGDFRSYEHTFSLITQVIGRSGRGFKKGRAYLQTYIPDHYVLNLAANQDYNEFYAQEIAIRKAFLYPPICDLCVVGLNGKDDEAVENAGKYFLDVMKQHISNEKPNLALRVLGLARCGFERIDERYRYRIILKCKNTVDFRMFLTSVIKHACKSKHFNGVSVYADLNGEVGY